MISQHMSARAWCQGRQPGDEIERLEHDGRLAVALTAARRVDDATVIVEGEPAHLLAIPSGES